jgi:hypothetical protein
MTVFRDAIRSPLTKDRYEKRLDLFFRFINQDGTTLDKRAEAFAARAKNDADWAINEIMIYMRNQKERAEKGQISESTISNYFKPIKLFCEMNDIMLNWKKITRAMPRGRRSAMDRAPSIDEIRRLMEYPDRRIKPIVLTMISSGIRVGAWDYLRWGHIEPMMKDGKVVAAKIRVYVGDPEEYTSFITSEAYDALKEWMDFREKHGEVVTKSSWLMRMLWDTSEERGAILPKKLQSSGVKRLIERALWTQGIRTPLAEGTRRHEFQADHGFRKFFKSTCERHMKSLHVEMMMGHNVGLAENYYRPSQQEILEDYLKALPDLVINGEAKLRAEDQFRSEEVSKKLAELEEAKKKLEDRLNKMEQDTKELKELIMKLDRQDQ